MDRRDDMLCQRILWHGRDAYALDNGLIRLVTLSGGGHIAELCFRPSSGRPETNPLWVPPWKTIDPDRYREKVHARRYGPPIAGRLLCGLVGHNLCLDYFGTPSDEEALHGLSIHGEAPSSRWRKRSARAGRDRVSLGLSVRLPAAGLGFDREIQIRRGESVAYFKETVTNHRKADHFFHWTQHVTLGPPFLDQDDCRIAIPATKGRTFPHGYEGHELLESRRDFRWPRAPGTNGESIDLRRPFLHPGLGFVATVLLDPRRDLAFVAATNRKLGLVLGYSFRRSDFPWVAIWEENKARGDAPWNGVCQARGLEFGSTPFPVGRRESFASERLFGAPNFSVVPALGRKTVRYLSFLAHVRASRFR